MIYFKDCIKNYLKLDEEIKILDKAIKVRKEKKLNYSESILSFIQSKDISHIKLQGSYEGKQMQCETRITKTSVPFKKVIETITEHFDNPNDASVLINKINENRSETQHKKLRIGKPGKVTSKSLNSLIKNNKTNNQTSKPEEANKIPDSMNYLYTTIHNA